MVKVVERSLEERAREESHRELMGIAVEQFGAEKVIEVGGLCFDIKLTPSGLPNDSIFISSWRDQISVYRPEHFDLALELAKAYEEKTQREFTLRKKY